LYATTRQFLDDLGLASLDQLPLLPSVDTQAAALSTLNPPEEDPSQPSLSLEQAVEELESFQESVQETPPENRDRDNE
jgi:segregation and condensation protein B